jgi:multidrug efflux pump subunit AcrA (membrane-fusion protein)
MNDFSRFNSRLKEPRLPRSSLVAWSLFALLAVFIAWASLFHLDEVTTGSGKVIPSSHEQVIQSLEGGIIHSLMVREGDIVERGQQLAQLDRTKTESSVLESESRLNAALATAARLKAEVNDTELRFPRSWMTTLSWSNRKRRSISPVAKASKKGWPVCVRAPSWCSASCR